MYALQLLGGVAIEGPEGPLSGYSTHRRELAVLAMLAAAGPGGASRDKLLACLWPDASSDSARHSLTDAVYRLRKELGADVIDGHSTTLRLNPGIIRCDVVAFEAALEAGDPAAAVREYSGPFLDGFHVRGSVEFEHWRDSEARRLEQAAEAALETLSDRAEAVGESASASAWLRRLFALDPYNSRTALRLMSALADSGDPANAILLAEEHRAFLAAELGVEPPAELLNSAASLQLVAPSTTSLPFLASASTSDKRADAFPFVGRDSERHELDVWLEAASAGKGRVGFITSDPGSGKTALAREFCRIAMDRDPSLIVASGACNAQTGLGDPYHPFREILGLLTGDVEARWSAGSVSADHATRLWSLLPAGVEALLDTGPDLVGSLVPESGLLARSEAHTGIASGDMTELRRLAKRRASAPPLRQTNLFEQYLRVLRHMARGRTVLLLVDDLQWADAGSVSLLFHLGRQLAGNRILVLGLYRPAEVALGRDGERHPLEPVVNEFATLFGDVRIELGLEGERDFVDRLLDSEPNVLDSDFRASLFRQTKGHALYTVELLRSFREQGVLTRNEHDEWVAAPDLEWTRVPPRVEAAIGERIQRLSPELLELLAVASVEGEEFTIEVAAEVLGSDVRRLMAVVSLELEKRHQLVVTQGIRRLNGQRQSICRFRHNLFQRYVYDGLDAIQRPDLHGRVGEALVSLFGDQDGEAAVSLAHHFREAGLDAKTVKYLAVAGAWAKRTGAPSVGLDLYRDALGVLARTPATPDRDRREMELNIALGQGVMEAGAFASPETEAFYSRAAGLARHLGDDTSLVQAGTGLYLVFQCRRELDRAYELAEENLALAEKLDAPLLRYWTRDQFARVLGIRGDNRRALQIEESLLTTLEAHPDSGEALPWAYNPTATLLTTLAMRNWIAGRPDRALGLGLRGLGMARHSADPATPSLALLYVTWVRLWRGEPDEAEELVSELGALVGHFGMDHYLPYVQGQRGWCAVGRGDLDEGIDLLRAGIGGLNESGSTIWITCFMAALGGALTRKGRFEEASAILEEALRDEITTKDLEHHVETLRQKGELLMARGDDVAAKAVLREAIDVARKQGARSYELRVCTTLAELLNRLGREDEGHEMLRAVYDGFTEGLETADLIRARAFLAGH